MSLRAMFSNMEVFKIYSAMARHAAQSQQVSATNISRADDPGFKATEVESFQDYLNRTAMTPTDGALPTSFRVTESNMPAAPNGNSVSIEHELYKSAEAMGEHEMALTVYSKSLDLLRSAIGRKR